MWILDVFNPYSVILVGFAITAFSQGRQTWMLSDFFGTLIFGISLLFTPSLLLSIQTDIRLDGISLHMGRAVGSMLLSSAFFTYYAFATDDDAEKEALVRARVLGNALLITAMFYAQTHYREWNIAHIQISFVGCILWTLPSLYYFLVLPTSPKSTPDRYNFFLNMDFLFTFIFGIAWFAFPQWLLRYQIAIKPNGVSVHMTRVFGALMISSAIISQEATNFSSNETKKVVLMSRVIGALPLLVIVVYGQVHGYFSNLHIFIGVTGAGFWTANAFLGILIINYTEALHAKQDRHLGTASSAPSASLSSTAAYTSKKTDNLINDTTAGSAGGMSIGIAGGGGGGGGVSVGVSKRLINDHGLSMPNILDSTLSQAYNSSSVVGGGSATAAMNPVTVTGAPLTSTLGGGYDSSANLQVRRTAIVGGIPTMNGYSSATGVGPTFVSGAMSARAGQIGAVSGSAALRANNHYDIAAAASTTYLNNNYTNYLSGQSKTRKAKK